MLQPQYDVETLVLKAKEKNDLSWFFSSFCFAHTDRCKGFRISVCPSATSIHSAQVVVPLC